MFLFKKNRIAKRASVQTAGRTKPVYSYYSNQSNTSGTKTKNKDVLRHAKKRFNIHNLPATILFLAIAVSLIYSAQLSSNPIIMQNSSDAGLFLHDKNTYQDTARKYFKSSLLNSNKITVDTSKIEESIKRDFPELQSVIITIPIFSHRPTVSLVPNRPTIKLISSNVVYIVDQDGKVISYLNDGDMYNLPTVTDESNLEVQVGRSILPADNVTFILEVSRQLIEKKIDVQTIVLPAKVEEVDVKLKTKPYIVKMNLQSDARQQVGAYLATREYLSKRNINPSQYIDVRVDERVYFK